MKVLIPTDFSVQADYAYLLVKRLSERTAMEVHFLHVLAVPDTVWMDDKGEVQTCGEIDPEYVMAQKRIAEGKLEHLRTLYGMEIQTHLVLGKLTTGIHQFAERGGYDLIVMGTKGARGIKEKLSGSETQMVARVSQVPVLSLMCDRSNLDLNHVLLVHDFAEGGGQDLRVLHALKQAYGTRVHLLQIVPEDSEATQARVRGHMAEFASANNLGEVDMHILHDRNVELGVVHFQETHPIDLICIGTHGKGGLFHHSYTEDLIKHLAKPIISFHLKH